MHEVWTSCRGPTSKGGRDTVRCWEVGSVKDSVAHWGAHIPEPASQL